MKFLLCFLLSFTAANAYDFLYLAQEWSPGTCVKEDCRVPDLKTPNVMGLFPSYLNDTWPLYCNKSATFDVAKTEGLSEMLHERIVAQYRHNTVQDNDELYWKDLYLMHGTCTHFNQVDYFYMTLQLALKFDFKDALAEKDVFPSNDRLYKTDEIKKILGKAFGALPQLECTGRDLTKVWVCLDSSLEAIDCPIARYQECGDLISFRASSEDRSDSFSFGKLLGLESAPHWVTQWLIPFGLMLLLLSNVAMGYYLAKRYLERRRGVVKGEKSLETVPVLNTKHQMKSSVV